MNLSISVPLHVLGNNILSTPGFFQDWVGKRKRTRHFLPKGGSIQPLTVSTKVKVFIVYLIVSHCFTSQKIKYAVRCDGGVYVFPVVIVSLHQTMPSFLETVKCPLHGHLCLAESVVQGCLCTALSHMQHSNITTGTSKPTILSM